MNQPSQQVAGFEVAVSEGSVVVSMGSPPVDRKLEINDFAEKPQTIVPPVEMSFYVALNAQGVLERCVSTATVDRKAVAALIGNWVAEGYLPALVSPKELTKLLRDVEKLAKDRKALAEAAAATVAAISDALQTSPSDATPAGDAPTAGAPDSDSMLAAAPLLS